MCCSILLVLLYVSTIDSVRLDYLNCGIDNELEVSTGGVEVTTYPWIGILYYSYYSVDTDSRAVTTVILIQREFVIANAADIGPMPKHNFRQMSRVLLGENWRSPGRRVRNYVIHPEYGETYNTVALIHLKDVVRDPNIKPVCPPPDILRNPTFYVMKFEEDYDKLQKNVIEVTHIPGYMCEEFYIAAKLHSKKYRPPHVACIVQLDTQKPCVWEAGAALVSRDIWGRWQLLGLGLRGPGCGMPARFLDMMSYYPWVEASIAKFQRITISKINKHKYVLRSGGNRGYQRFGACDEDEKKNLVFREAIVLRTDNTQYQFLTYNMTLYQSVELTCLTLEIVNASAVSEMSIQHQCPHISHGAPCHFYSGSRFDISVYIMFSDKCLFEMYAWGSVINMTFLGIQEWKWEEGTYYEDFTMLPTEYRGQEYQTGFGFEPIDNAMWVPDYDIWTTTEFENDTRTTTEPPPMDVGDSGAEPATLPPPPGGTLAWPTPGPPGTTRRWYSGTRPPLKEPPPWKEGVYVYK